jgi:Cu+-exporting ATPase
MKNESKDISNKKEMLCFHCGDICRDNSITKEDKLFCCQSCKLVYEILQENNMCRYYDIDSNPGISPSVRSEVKYEYLDEDNTKKQLLDFSDGKISTATFSIPQMHCSSCIWLLENFYKLDPGVTHSQVNFPEKKFIFKFLEEKTSLRKIAELLDSIGYEPMINLDATERKSRDLYSKKLYYKIGIAGFCFGNIMLLSFPEYLGINKVADPMFYQLFGYLNLILSLPVFFYSSSEYYISAYKGLRSKVINLDFILFLGILVLFVRSVVEIITQSAAGYMDSMSGLVFFLLIGKVFQSKTYESMSFERTYKSYFPLSITILKNGIQSTVSLSKLRVGDRMVIRSGEIIPADSILFKGDGNIDYSFVTGESQSTQKVMGEIIYAGGRQIGSVIELEVLKDVSQSYLTQLWNSDTFTKTEESRLQTFSNIISKYFTIAILALAFAAAAFWMPVSFNTAMNVFTAVLIVSCPCALALAIPFTYGNVMRIFGRNKFYIKNTFVIEKLSNATSVVFDKTGTITQNKKSVITFEGRELNEFELSLVKSLSRQSTHPLSRKIFDFLEKYETKEVSDYFEYVGKGVAGEIEGLNVKMGSEEYVTSKESNTKFNTEISSSRVYLSVNDIVLGYFNISNSYRTGLAEVIQNLEKKFSLHLLSGDNESERDYLQSYFKDPLQMYFKQTPENKLKYIKALQNEGENVLMIGDGLNDAGALKQSDIGISISEDVSNFSPACDGILNSEEFQSLPNIIKLSKDSFKIIIFSFAASFVYNLLALGIAVEGLLQPIVAAILMPVSSISVVVFCVVSTNYFAKRRKFK